MKNSVCAYQIYYSEETQRQLDTGFRPLNNLSNPRPDWREYWPIRNFLLAATELDENAYYGFLSPKFSEKSNLTSDEVLRFVESQPPSTDVFSFSPFFDQTAMFLNIFEQGESHHPGLMGCTHTLLASLGLDTGLPARIGHSRNTIFCNYFFAKPAFWRTWLEFNEVIFSLCEENTSALAHKLNAGTEHAGSSSCPLKVFLIERTASLLLMSGRYACIPYQPIERPRTNSRIATLDSQLVIADALKQAYTASGDDGYLEEFRKLRQSVIQSL